MKAVLKSILLLFPFLSFAQNPELVSLSPARIQTQSDPVPIFLTINGKNMWPDRLTISMAHDIMHVHFKRDGRDVIMPRSTIGTYGYTLYFNSPGWADKPGTIEVFVTIDSYPGYAAYRSNSIYLVVEPTPTVAPVLTGLSNSTFKTGNAKESYKFRVTGKNFGENSTTSVTIGGIKAGVGWWNLKDGVMDVWIPSEVYSTEGNYPVVVRTKYGISNALNLKIEKTMMVKPVIIPAKPTTVVTNTKVKPGVNPAVNAARLSLNTENDARLKTDMLRGVRVTLAGVIKDASLSAQLESYMLGLEHVFVVDNQLALSDSGGNININLKATAIDKATVEQMKKAIQDKANQLNLQVSIAY